MREYCGFKVLELEDEEMKGEDNEQGCNIPNLLRVFKSF